MMDAGRMAPYVGFTEAEVHDLFWNHKLLTLWLTL